MALVPIHSHGYRPHLHWVSSMPFPIYSQLPAAQRGLAVVSLVHAVYNFLVVPTGS
jgi:hypothetical protein